MVVREAECVHERNGGGTWIGRYWQRAAGAVFAIALAVVVYFAFLQPADPVRLSGIDAHGEQQADSEPPGSRHDRAGGDARQPPGSRRDLAGGGVPGFRIEGSPGTSPTRSQYASSVERVLGEVLRTR